MAATCTPSELTPDQTHVLFDILTHRETYREIEDFKIPGAIDSYGPPFQSSTRGSTSPILQTLVSKFALRLPGLRDVSPDFWTVRVADLIQELAQAELSESYDKGLLGIRKTLATAVSAIIEYPARGCLGGFPKKESDGAQKGDSGEYDVGKAEDVLRAWQDCLQAIVYGDFIDTVFQRAAETDDLTQHSTLVQAMHEFIIVNLASFMHYTLILSPEGSTLLRMAESVHRLIPYTIVRQTLKIGNVASMISAMMKVVLAKVSVGSVTNWMGLSSGADEGMNLLQQIISQVLNWDKRDLRNRADKIEKGKQAPPKEVREILQKWIRDGTREEHQECRRMSQDQEMSMVAVILALSSGPLADDLSETQHANACEWLGLQLAVRDRQEIVKVLCKRNPDHLTAAIYDVVNAYTPMIRQVHQAVNLSDTVWDFERFVTDLLKMSKPAGPKGQEKPPTVEDYVDLLHRHQQSSHKFLHQVSKNGTEVMSWWREYVTAAAAEFRLSPTSGPTSTDSSDLPAQLAATFTQLSDDERSAVLAELGAHRAYLDALHAASAARIRAVITRSRSTPFGPGAYLARWQDLLDATPVTPAAPHGPVRCGASRQVRDAARKGADGEPGPASASEERLLGQAAEQSPDPPAAERTLAAFGARFREMLAARAEAA